MEFRKVADLKPHPKNSEYFKDITGQDFTDFVKSIKEHGIIEPVVIKQDGTILCGEQRWRAAKEAGLKEVPVVIRECSGPEEEESIIIEENIRRRQISTSETARAVKRLYEVYGVKKGRDRKLKLPRVTLKQITKQADLSEKQVKVYHTLANLIPEISGLLDEKKITQKVAYQLAQLPAGDQKTAYHVLTSEIVKLSGDKVKEYKLKLREKNNQIFKQWDQIQELQKRLALLSDKESEIKKKIQDEQNAGEFKKIQHEKEILNMRIKGLSEEVEIVKQQKEEALEIMRNTLRTKEQEGSQAVEENEKLKEKLKDIKEDLEILALNKEGTNRAKVLLFCLEAVDINIPNVMKIIYNPRYPFALSEAREELKSKLHHTQNLISSALKELEKIKNNTLQYHPADTEETEEGEDLNNE